MAVKIAAVHNVAAIASGMARAGADIIVLDGFRGGTGAAPKRIRDNVGIPIELALAAVDERLRQEGIRSTVSLVASGTLRNAADVVRAVALGADAVLIGRPAAVAAVGGGAEGVKLLLDTLKRQLMDAMMITGVRDLSHVPANIVRKLD